MNARSCALAVARAVARWPSPAASRRRRRARGRAKPIRMIVTFPPGGSHRRDRAHRRAQARRAARPAGHRRQPARRRRQHRPGDRSPSADPDGYTIGVGAAGGLAANVSALSEDAVRSRRRTSCRSRCSRTSRSSSSASRRSPIKTRRRPDRAGQGRARARSSVGHGGNGTAMHLSVQLLKLMAGVDLTEVAYKGSGPVALDVIGGQVPAGDARPAVGAAADQGRQGARARRHRQHAPAAAARRADARRGGRARATSRPAGSASSRRRRRRRRSSPACRPRCAPSLTDPEVDRRRARRSASSSAPTTLGRVRPLHRAARPSKWADVIKRSGTKLD